MTMSLRAGGAPQRLLLTALRASVKGAPAAEQSPTKPATPLRSRQQRNSTRVREPGQGASAGDHGVPACSVKVMLACDVNASSRSVW